MICHLCREVIPDDSDVIEDLDGANVCGCCRAEQLYSNPYARSLLRPERTEEEQEARDRAQNKRV